MYWLMSLESLSFDKISLWIYNLSDVLIDVMDQGDALSPYLPESGSC